MLCEGRFIKRKGIRNLSSEILIKEVLSKADRKTFVEYPNLLYRDVENFVPAFYGDDMADWDKDKNYDRLGLDEHYVEFLGNKIVCHNIPIRPGRNLAIIVESAAVNYRQKKMGYDAARELYNRVQANMAKNLGGGK